MPSIAQATNNISPASQGVEMQRVLEALRVDNAALKAAIGVINARLDALGGNFIAGSAGTTNVSGNTPVTTVTA